MFLEIITAGCKDPAIVTFANSWLMLKGYLKTVCLQVKKRWVTLSVFSPAL
jgi:hypothetical protein